MYSMANYSVLLNGWKKPKLPNNQAIKKQCKSFIPSVNAMNMHDSIFCTVFGPDGNIFYSTECWEIFGLPQVKTLLFV